MGEETRIYRKKQENTMIENKTRCRISEERRLSEDLIANIVRELLNLIEQNKSDCVSRRVSLNFPVLHLSGAYNVISYAVHEGKRKHLPVFTVYGKNSYGAALESLKEMKFSEGDSLEITLEKERLPLHWWRKPVNFERIDIYKLPYTERQATF